MAQGGGGSNGPTYLVLSLLGLIAILLIVKELGLQPKKVSSGAFSVEFQDGVPKAAKPAEAPSAEDASKLAERVRELERQLKSGTIQQTEHPGPVPQNSKAAGVRNIAGIWRVGPISMNIMQSGAQAVVRVYNFDSLLTSVGEGTLYGSDLSISYVNAMYLPGKMVATLSEDDQRITVTDYGTGYPQTFVMYRAQ